MSKALDWMKTNTVPLIAMAAVLAITVAGGCQLFNHEAEVPKAMQEANGGKATINDARADALAAAYKAKVDAEISRDEVVLTQKVKDANAAYERMASEIEKDRLAMVEKADKANKDLDALQVSVVEARTWNTKVAEVFWGGVNTATTAASSLPGAGLILPTLTGLIGLFIRKPGDSAKIAEATTKADTAEAEKKQLVAKVDAEWQHGFETGKSVAKTA